MAKSDSEVWEAVAEELESGQPLSDALKLVEHRLPPFYLPLIQTGEHTGRLAEVLLYLADHCRLLARPQRALRNVWLAPLAVYLAGIPLKVLMLMFLGAWWQLRSALVDAIAELGSLAAIAVIVLSPPLKPAWDRLRVIIPILGKAERDLSVSRFLRVFAMLYASGGMRVENMIRFAAKAVSNDYFRRDLLRAAKRIEQRDSISQAFSAVTCLTAEEHGSIATGDVSGMLESVCERIATGLDEGLEARMKIVTSFAVRIMLGCVTLSITALLVNMAGTLILRKLQQ